MNRTAIGAVAHPKQPRNTPPATLGCSTLLSFDCSSASGRPQWMQWAADSETFFSQSGQLIRAKVFPDVEVCSRGGTSLVR